MKLMKCLQRNVPSLGCCAAQRKPVWVRPLGDEHPAVTVPHPRHEVPTTPGGGQPGPPQHLRGTVSCTV